jgi:DNA-binding XRE family transcriptional regulator
MNKWAGLVLNLNLPAAQVARQIQQWLAKKRGPKLRPFAQIRQERGWSRMWAADLLQISAGYLGQLERGQAPLSLPLAERMAGLYEVDLNKLVRVSQ